jgi:hypothetical protein
MTLFSGGELVTVNGEGGERDGIVFHVPSRSKVIVAIPDAARGAVMRTFNPDVLAERADAGPNDEVLRKLIRRTPLPGGGGMQGVNSSGRPARGHTRAPAHRSTGK